MPSPRYYGLPGAWPSVRRSLVDHTATSVAGCVGMRVCSVQSTCRHVRDVIYSSDRRWAETAADPVYARMFGRRKWWPDALWKRAML